MEHDTHKEMNYLYVLKRTLQEQKGKEKKQGEGETT